MSAIHRHLQRTVDQTSGAVQRQAVKPSTVGSAQRGAEATRTANAGSSRRAGPGATKEAGERFAGKQLKSAVRDWVQSAKAAQGALDEGLKALKLAQDSGSDTVVAMLEEACQMLVDRLNEIMARGVELADMIQGEQSTDETAGQPDAEGVVETNTGEVPREDGSAGALDSAAMDAGVRLVRSHGMDVSMSHVATVDAASRLQAEQAGWKKAALQAAIVDGEDPVEVNRIRHGLARPVSTDPVGDFNKRFGAK